MPLRRGLRQGGHRHRRGTDRAARRARGGHGEQRTGAAPGGRRGADLRALGGAFGCLASIMHRYTCAMVWG